MLYKTLKDTSEQLPNKIVEVDDPKVHYNANTDETLKRYFDE